MTPTQQTIAFIQQATVAKLKAEQQLREFEIKCSLNALAADIEEEAPDAAESIRQLAKTILPEVDGDTLLPQRRRGRPPGSTNKPKPEVTGNGSST